MGGEITLTGNGWNLPYHQSDKDRNDDNCNMIDGLAVKGRVTGVQRGQYGYG